MLIEIKFELIGLFSWELNELHLSRIHCPSAAADE